jgi:hypothetical protein
MGTLQGCFDLGLNKEFDTVFRGEDVWAIVDEWTAPHNLEALAGEPSSVMGDEAVVSLSHASDAKQSLQV